MEIYKIVLIIGAVGIGGSLGVYSFLKTMAKRGESVKKVETIRIHEVTLEYVKDWMKVEIGADKDRAAAIMRADCLGESMDSLVPEELQKDPGHLLILTASRKGMVYKVKLICFETVEKELSAMLEKNNGVIKVEK